jgi:hypothetical protein
MNTADDNQRAQSGPAAIPQSGPVAEQVAHRVRRGLFGAWKDLRFVAERPPSLLEHIAYAERGEWTEEIDGYARHGALVFAWLVAIPISTLAYLVAWASARPGRCVSTVAVFLLLSTAAAESPSVGWVIPRWANLTCWPPFVWIF